MKTVAIIAEYNPFHNGHKYIVEQAKKATNADFCISIMSGNFLQRGFPGMWDKYTRAAIAAYEGVDLCLELPFPYATGSAYDFAIGAISILTKLNAIDYLCFGVETNDIAIFNDIVNILIEEPYEYKSLLKDNLSKGMSFPIARANALSITLNNDSLIDILAKPNNILAIEYIHALKLLNSPIKPITIKRINAEYHDINLRDNISSASSIRNQFFEYDNFPKENIEIFKSINSVIPKHTKAQLFEIHHLKGPIYPEDLMPFVQSKLISNFDYSNICDFNQELNNKLLKLSPMQTYNNIIDTLKTKDITTSRISRALLHMILGYTNEHRKIFSNEGYAYYANILAFRKNSSMLLKDLSTKSNIPIITKKADFTKSFGNYPEINYENAKIMWDLDISATTLFNCLIYNRYKYSNANDYTIQLPII